jgi:glutamate-1-semialdehyde 2,1-aminomutase
VDYKTRLESVIPGGAHTYSRGSDQFPQIAPQILSKGKGVHVYDASGKAFLDYGMALRAVNIGYAEDSIDSAAFEAMRLGNNLTRPSMLELEAAELLVETIDSAEMVKFTKNGSTAVTAAVKLARAYTGRTLVARCANQPFFSYDDWFIASTPITKGIPADNIEKIKKFDYNDIHSLERLIAEYPNEIACVVIEPATTTCPSDLSGLSFDCAQNCCREKGTKKNLNFLQEVQKLCTKNGIVFVLDEMITGFRWDLKGAQNVYGVDPDISTFGKAMANGFSVACVAGKREILSLGSIEKKGSERVFLLSTTHGAEMVGLGAFIETVKFIKENRVIDHLWSYGGKLVKMMNSKAKELGIENYFTVGGINCSPYYETKNKIGEVSLDFRSLFNQEMIRNGVLMPWIALAYRHDELELQETVLAVEKSLQVYRKALEDGFEKYLVGSAIKPVFRKYN